MAHKWTKPTSFKKKVHCNVCRRKIGSLGVICEGISVRDNTLPYDGLHYTVTQEWYMYMQWNLGMQTRLGPPVCVLIVEVVLFEGLINILIGHLGLVQVS